jgi:hypothetical protein
MPERLLSNIIIELPIRAFRALTDGEIAEHLHSQSIQVRKATALKCIRTLPRRRVSALLASYLSSPESRYYNVIHWLDLGVSAPADRVVPAAERAIAWEWRRQSD